MWSRSIGEGKVGNGFQSTQIKMGRVGKCPDGDNEVDGQIRDHVAF